MAQVRTDSEILDALQLKLLDETSILNALTQDLEDKYDELGETWRDANYIALGDILLDCTRACRKTVRELDSAREMLNGLLNAVREYEDADIGGSSDIWHNGPVDTSSLAGNAVTSGWPLISGTHTRNEDLNATNPGYHDDVNRQINCQRCVPAYVMRRRGFNVQAQAIPSAYAYDHLSCHPEAAWRDAEVLACNGTGMSEITSQMLAWGEGAQAEIGFFRRGRNVGHVFIAEVVNGEVRFFNPQEPSQDASRYFSVAEPGRTTFWRVDTLDPSEYMNDCCERVPR